MDNECETYTHADAHTQSPHVEESVSVCCRAERARERWGGGRLFLCVCFQKPSSEVCLKQLAGNAGFDNLVREANESRLGRISGGEQGRMLAQQSTEAGLLNYLLGRLEKLDADVYCGHNIAAFDMDVLLHRLQHNKVLV